MEQIENHMVVDACWEPIINRKRICFCLECEKPIYEDDDYYDFDGDVVCESCMEDFVNVNFKRGASAW